MMMSRVFSVVLALGLLFPLSAAAQTDPTATETTKKAKQSIREEVKAKRETAKTALDEYKTAREDQKIVKLKAYGLRLIEHRLDAVEKQTARLGTVKCKKVDAVFQTALKTGMTAVETNLNSQKTTLEAATTVEEAKIVITAVVKDNRVFMFLVPAANGACLAQTLIELIDGKLTTAANKLKTAGLDTGKIEVKMAQAKQDAQAAYDIYIAIVKQPGGADETNRAKMAEAKALLQKVRQALGDIKSDIAALRGEYQKKLKNSSGRVKTRTSS